MTNIANRNNWLDYLRSFIILLVVAHHSSLAYTSFAQFNNQAYILSTHPIVDTVRWKGLDIFEDFNDIFFMSLLFLISGIFVVPSLERKGVKRFIGDRFRRLFIPFAIGVVVIMPVAYYPSWLLAHGQSALWGDGWLAWSLQQGWGGLWAYISDFFTVESWPAGPLWFIWILFFFDLVFAGCYPFIKKWVHRWSFFLSRQQQNGAIVFLGWLVLSCIAYIPLVPSAGANDWTGLGPFDFQVSRLVLYGFYFLLGVLIGAPGPDNGILSTESAFVKTGSFWLTGCVCGFAALTLSQAPLTEPVDHHQLAHWQGSLMYRGLWISSCTLSCIAFLTIFSERMRRTHPRWEAFSANAYGVYLVHYVFVTWCQYWLLEYNLPAVIKFMISFILSVLLSVATIYSIRRVRMIRKPSPLGLP